MLSEQQYEEKLRKVDTVVKSFLGSKKTISEISKETGIPSSSVQRYLNDITSIKTLYKDDSNLIIEAIKGVLENNRLEAPYIGGLAFASNNISTKDSYGHFTGSRRR